MEVIPFTLTDTQNPQIQNEQLLIVKAADIYTYTIRF
jgi:hypothetical protein